MRAPEQAEYVHETLEELLALDGYVTSGCGSYAEKPVSDSVTVQTASDDYSERWMNAMQDGEVISKLHILRMELEDMIASADQSYQPDYYSPNSRAVRVLGAAVPELTQVYSEQWLPIITIMTHVESPEIRDLLMRSHISSDVVAGIGDGKAGELTETEQLALMQALGTQRDVRLEATGGKGRIVIGDIDIPVSFVEDDEVRAPHSSSTKVAPSAKTQDR